MSYETSAIAKGRELRRVAGEARARCVTARVRAYLTRGETPFAGGSGLDLVSIFRLLATPICAECLARRTDTAPIDVYESLRRLAQIVALRTHPGRCEGCESNRMVHSIA